ncbi:2-oxoisovalerate dehydrogenase [Breznakibacter xylanolyticus]|nr:2-oxoisovalerate dehydrogenase [Breznakibacter xylanolyticus]
MNELVFIAEESEEGGFVAKAVNHSIFTEGNTIDELKANIIDAVKCHFDEKDLPKLIHLHLTREETFAL